MTSRIVIFENPRYFSGGIHPDGSCFVLVVNQVGVAQDDNTPPDEIYTVTNWFTELRERMGEN